MQLPSEAQVSTPLLSTKLYLPSPRQDLVPRPRLLEKLNKGARGRFTLVSAPAGFGKTTLVSEWASLGSVPVAWLSLDEGDNDQVRFLLYFIAALQSVGSNVGETALAVLQSPQPPQIVPILQGLINELMDTSKEASTDPRPGSSLRSASASAAATATRPRQPWPWKTWPATASGGRSKY